MTTRQTNLVATNLSTILDRSLDRRSTVLLAIAAAALLLQLASVIAAQHGGLL